MERTEAQQRKYEKQKQWNENNREKMREYYRRYYEENRKARIQAVMDSRRKHRDAACERAKKWWHSRPIEVRKQLARRNSLWTRFRVTPEWYDEKLSEQGGGCATCGDVPTQKKFAVDHDHACCETRGKTCGKCVRGILCHRCNMLVGYLEELLALGVSLSDACTGWALKAKEYLEKYKRLKEQQT